MRRFAPWIITALAITIIVMALAELSSRDVTDGALGTPAPTSVPSPSPDPTLPTVAPTAPPVSPAPTVGLPSPTAGTAQASPDPTPTAQPTAAPTATPAPTATTTPVPGTGTTGGTTAGRDGPTPVTGGGAFAGGFVVLLMGALGRAFSSRRPHTGHRRP